MTSQSIYHYVYRITNIAAQKHYYGKRSSKVHPRLDLGIKYFSSASDKAFITEQKTHPSNFKYKIIKVFHTVEESLRLEIKLHQRFNVATHPKFYNKANQTSTGFDTTGTHISTEHKAKIGASGKGKSKTLEHRMKIGQPQKGVPKPRTAAGVLARSNFMNGLTDEEFIAKFVTPQRKHFSKPGSREVQSKASSHGIYMFISPRGIITEHHSINQFAIENGLNISILYKMVDKGPIQPNKFGKPSECRRLTNGWEVKLKP